MEPSLRLVPAASTSKPVSVADTAGSLGLHDTLTHGARSLAADVAPKHTLETRLAHWEETQQNLRLTMDRNTYGLHAPVRQLMERHIVSQTSSPLSFRGFTRPSNLHLDILTGQDETLDVSDVLIGPSSVLDTRELPISFIRGNAPDRVTSTEEGIKHDFHLTMERKLNM